MEGTSDSHVSPSGNVNFKKPLGSVASTEHVAIAFDPPICLCADPVACEYQNTASTGRLGFGSVVAGSDAEGAIRVKRRRGMAGALLVLGASAS